MRRHGAARAWTAEAAAAGAIAAVLAAGVVLPHAPVSFENAWGFAPEVSAFTAFPSKVAGPWPEATYVAALRGTLIGAWGLWALAVLLLAQARGGVSTQVTRVITLVAPLVAAVLVPPLLSRDVLGYVAYGRLPGLHGLNPYLEGRAALAGLGDPAASFLVWDTPLPYGPLWTLMAAGLAKGAAGGGVWLEVLLHKGVAAVAVMLAAFAGGRLAALRDPSNAALTEVAIASSPLLLLEGPGMGHNDGLMVAFMVWAALSTARGRHVSAALLLGAATAIKPVAVFAIPLLVFEQWRRGSGGLRALGLGTLCFVPTLVLSAAYGGPWVIARSVFERAAARPGLPVLPIVVLSLVALGAALWMVHRDVLQQRAAPWLTAWAPVALAIAVVVLPVRFPWYITWALVPVLADLDKRNVGLLAAVALLGVFLTWQYTVPL